MAKKGFKNIDIKQLEEDSEVYSSKHYIYGELIVKCWRDFVKVKVENEGGISNEHAGADEGVPGVSPSLTI